MTELRSLRLLRGLSVADVSKRSGIPAPTLFSYENGTRSLLNASFRNVLALSKALAVKAEDLLGEEDFE